ncbi:CAP domain-containing protein [Photobacterium sp. BZF1]|uniref:CAP domain-containing protein n=1 Tax=Photobacterium sp. BZF1 TaxID=1904457 RepID=UPI001653E81B|nr:CAP domain-containing protein [Photobacterium sp. BZF1]MBC7006485.1 CAP domain-containing protein [Photobacterium sp. BZF1]
MKVLPLVMLSALLLVGCGSGGSSSSDGNSGSIPGDDIGSGGDNGSGGDTGSGGDNGNNGDNGNTDPDPAPGPGDTFAEQMLFAVNQARAEEQNCGGQIMPAVPALTWDYDLESAAYSHSSDMANNNFMSHTGSDGSTPQDRIEATGYSWSTWAENVAAGQKDINAVMTSWMNSPGHCKNIMNGSVTEMGASFVENSSTQYGIYWTQVFAKPR